MYLYLYVCVCVCVSWSARMISILVVWSFSVEKNHETFAAGNADSCLGYL